MSGVLPSSNIVSGNCARPRPRSTR